MFRALLVGFLIVLTNMAVAQPPPTPPGPGSSPPQPPAGAHPPGMPMGRPMGGPGGGMGFQMPEPSKEDRAKMADAHTKFAACLRSKKPIMECHKEMGEMMRAIRPVGAPGMPPPHAGPPPGRPPEMKGTPPAPDKPKSP